MGKRGRRRSRTNEPPPSMGSASISGRWVVIGGVLAAAAVVAAMCWLRWHVRP